jgi:o-succinylbenzoate---CoA ligase
MSKIRCLLDEAAEIHREQPALVCSNRTFSYQEYGSLVSTAAKRLKDAGCAEGERIALLLPNDWRYALTIMALLRVGAIACPLNSRTPSQGLKTLLDRIACQKVIASAQPMNRELFGHRQLLDPGELIDSAGAQHNIPALAEVDLGRPATIIFTSGSLGVPKAVLHSYGNHYYNAKGSNKNIPLRPGDRWLLALPLYHVGGLSILFRCFLSGATVVIPEKDEELQESLGRYEVTHLSAVPTQLYRLLREDNDKKSPRKLRAVLLGGAAVPRNLIEKGLAVGLPLYTSYGLTEMASQVTTTSADTPNFKRFTSGKALSYREVRLSATGEILVKGETLFKGYLEGGELELPADRDGWFATSDLGELDAEGYLTVTGRKDNMFISGGENIQPEEIERVLCEHWAVAQAVVVPVPDLEFGSRPVAFVQTNTGKVRSKELAAFLEDKLARYKIPIAFFDWPETAGSEGMKVSREFFRRIAARTSIETTPK